MRVPTWLPLPMTVLMACLYVAALETLAAQVGDTANGPIPFPYWVLRPLEFLWPALVPCAFTAEPTFRRSATNRVIVHDTPHHTSLGQAASASSPHVCGTRQIIPALWFPFLYGTGGNQSHESRHPRSNLCFVSRAQRTHSLDVVAALCTLYLQTDICGHIAYALALPRPRGSGIRYLYRLSHLRMQDCTLCGMPRDGLGSKSPRCMTRMGPLGLWTALGMNCYVSSLVQLCFSRINYTIAWLAVSKMARARSQGGLESLTWYIVQYYV